MRWLLRLLTSDADRRAIEAIWPSTASICC
jgi:hypothetical protein